MYCCADGVSDNFATSCYTALLLRLSRRNTRLGENQPKCLLIARVKTVSLFCCSRFKREPMVVLVHSPLPSFSHGRAEIGIVQTTSSSFSAARAFNQTASRLVFQPTCRPGPIRLVWCPQSEDRLWYGSVFL